MTLFLPGIDTNIDFHDIISPNDRFTIQPVDQPIGQPSLNFGDNSSGNWHGSYNITDRGYDGLITTPHQNIGNNESLNGGFGMSGDWHGNNNYQGMLNYNTGDFSTGIFVGGGPGGLNYGGTFTFPF
jgi:hypothetical protein